MGGVDQGACTQRHQGIGELDAKGFSVMNGFVTIKRAKDNFVWYNSTRFMNKLASIFSGETPRRPATR